ncbi:MAG: hypothetical protein EXS51_02235 [Candidatus Taylorbacteria bacterium]|nr:hypothetical protein [Candidatus Taylorbacteria bacterium]
MKTKIAGIISRLEDSPPTTLNELEKFLEESVQEVQIAAHPPTRVTIYRIRMNGRISNQWFVVVYMWAIFWDIMRHPWSPSHCQANKAEGLITIEGYPTGTFD